MTDIRVTNWSQNSDFHGGYVSYRIWKKLTPHGFFQRHEWRHENGSTHCGPWIQTKVGFLDGMTAVSEAEAA